jgi:hypothetical protein
VDGGDFDTFPAVFNVILTPVGIVALSAISDSMPDLERPRFNLRLTPELEALVNESARKNRRSKNAEILTALEWRFQPDTAMQLAEAIRPMLDRLSEEQRATFVELVKTMAAEPGKQRGKRR